AVDKGVIAVRPTLQTEIKFFGRHSVLNDPIAIYLNDATLAGAFVARWCVGYKVESADGVFQIRGADTVECARGSQDALSRKVGRPEMKVADHRHRFCCERAAIGQAVAAPPSRMMRSRLPSTPRCGPGSNGIQGSISKPPRRSA